MYDNKCMSILENLKPDCKAVWIQKEITIQYKFNWSTLVGASFILIPFLANKMKLLSYHAIIQLAFPPQLVVKASSNPLLVVVVVVANGSPENGSNEEVLVGVGKLLLPVCMYVRMWVTT